MNYNVSEIEAFMGGIMHALGVEPTKGNLDTPRRIAKMYGELFYSLNDAHKDELDESMTLFDNDGSSEDNVTMKDIEFSSMCEHHWLPFMGFAEVSYVPGDKIIGLSKIPRVVKYFSQRPQLQERLARDIGSYLVGLLNPKYLRVKLIATHTCVACRGANSNCITETSYTYYDGGFKLS